MYLCVFDRDKLNCKDGETLRKAEQYWDEGGSTQTILEVNMVCTVKETTERGNNRNTITIDSSPAQLVLQTLIEKNKLKIESLVLVKSAEAQNIIKLQHIE